MLPVTELASIATPGEQLAVQSPSLVPFLPVGSELL